MTGKKVTSKSPIEKLVISDTSKHAKDAENPRKAKVHAAI
jgi:hypothetical protein